MRTPGWSMFLMPAVLMAQAPETPGRIQRLSEAGRLWAKLKWTHPALAGAEVDWDLALVEALPALGAARTPEALEQAVAKLLEPLHDPALRLGPPVAPTWVETDPKAPTVLWLPGEVALLQLPSNPEPWSANFEPILAAALEAVPKAKALIFDLRPAGSAQGPPGALLNRILPQVLAAPLDLPALRYRYHSGYQPQRGASSGGYFSGYLTLAAERILPSPKAAPLPMAFIVNAGSGLPGAVLALQRAGLAFVVGAGAPNAGWVAPKAQLAMGKELRVELSAGEYVFKDSASGFMVDRRVAEDPRCGPEAPAVQTALELLGSQDRPGAKAAWKVLPSSATVQRDKPYAEMAFPGLPWRQLAVIRFWSVIDAFYPYKHLMDRPWTDALPEFLGRMEHVRNGREYVLVLAEMAARLQDNHVWVSHQEYRNAMGECGLPVTFRVVRGKVAVERMLEPAMAAKVGVRLWDEVLKVDGETVGAAMKRMEPFVASANPWTRDRNLVHFLGRGSEGTSAKLVLRGADGQLRTATLPRSARYSEPEAARDGQVIKLLPGRLGYADLDRLERGQVDELFEKVKGTRGLILDMRGYPRGTAWPMAPRLNQLGATQGASFQRNLVSGQPSEGELQMSFRQGLDQGKDKPVYPGKVVMLINEETQSQAEHTGLFFEAACGVTFIGSPSAGSNGDMTNLVLPGGVFVGFTGHDVRHVDGRQLQRAGLQPHLRSQPTLKGLRAGKDEVLDRAVRFLQTKR